MADGAVQSVAFSPDGTMLAAGSSDDSAQIWDLASGRLVSEGAPLRASASGYDETVTFSPDGRVLATGGDDGTVRLWDTGPAAAATTVCTMAGNPTRSEWARYVPGFPYAPPCRGI